jgi:hypothetical protein
MICRKRKLAVTCFFYGLLLAFAEDAFLERIEPISHNDSDNQLLNGRVEVDEPKDSSKTYFVVICL